MREAAKLAPGALVVLAACAGASAHGDARAGAPAAASHVASTEVLAFALVSANDEHLVDWLRSTLELAEVRPAGRAPLPWAALAPGSGGAASRRWLALGREVVEVKRWMSPPSRPYPPESRGDDTWFQHLAVVVANMDEAYDRLVHNGIVPISPAPQTIPLRNAAAGGIRAFYFRDPEGHPFELLWYPPGRGEPRWQNGFPSLFLGIDHTAIVVRETGASVAFYRDLLGLAVVGGSLNEGIEQERLSGVTGARVRITSLRGPAGPGIELLEYESPRRPRPLLADTLATDVASTEVRILVPSIGALEERLLTARSPRASREGDSLVLADPDGHRVRVVQR